MQVGSGLRLRLIGNFEHPYVWHYEREGGRSRRRKDYVGPARQPRTRQEAQRKILAYCRRVEAELASRIARLEKLA